MNVRIFDQKKSVFFIYITILLVGLIVFSAKVHASHAPVIPAVPYASQMPLPQYAVLADCNHGLCSLDITNQ
jgi:hypothetical protein